MIGGRRSRIQCHGQNQLAEEEPRARGLLNKVRVFPEPSQPGSRRKLSFQHRTCVYIGPPHGSRSERRDLLLEIQTLLLLNMNLGRFLYYLLEKFLYFCLIYHTKLIELLLKKILQYLEIFLIMEVEHLFSKTLSFINSQTVFYYYIIIFIYINNISVYTNCNRT